MARWWLARSIWPWLSVSVLLVLFAVAWPFSVDDAFILARYARRLAAGQGYTFSDGPPTDGVTGPLWLLPLWLGLKLGLHPLVAGKLFGGLATAVSVGRVVARAAGRAQGDLRAPLTCAFCLTSVPLVIWPVAGLETGLATWLCTEIALGVTRAKAPNVVWAGCCAGMCAWLRPELAFFVLALLAALHLRVARAAFRAWLIAGLGALAVLMFRKLTFGHWLPMSSAAKPPELGHGLRYVWSALARPENLLAFFALISARLSTGRLRPLARVVAFAVLAHAFAVLLAGGDWMPGLRLFCPVTPLFALLLAQAFVELWWSRRRLFWALLVPLLALRTSVMSQELSVARAAGITRERALPRFREVFRGQRGLVAAVDVGLLGEAYSGPILDLAGLTDPHIAYAPGGHLDKRLSSGWLSAQAVELFMLHSSSAVRVDEVGRLRWFQGFPVERRVLSMPWVRQDYRVREVLSYQAAYHYVLLTPAGAAP